MARFKNWFKRVFHHSDDAAVANGKPPTHPKARKEYRNRSRDDVYRVKDNKEKVKNFRAPLVVERSSLRTESLSSNSREEDNHNLTHEEEKEEINPQKEQQTPIKSLQDFEDWINGDLSLGPDKKLPSWTNAGVTFNSWQSIEDQVIVSDKSSAMDSLGEILDNAVVEEGVVKGDKILNSFLENSDSEGRPSIYEARTGTDSLEKFLDELPSLGSKGSQPERHEVPPTREPNVQLPAMESRETDSPHTTKDSLIEEIIKMLDAGKEPPGYNTFAGSKKKKKKHKYATDKSVQSFDDLVSTFESKSIFSEPPRTQNPKWFTMESSPTPAPPPPRRPTRRQPLPFHNASPEGYYFNGTPIQNETKPVDMVSKQEFPVKVVARSPPQQDLSANTDDRFVEESREAQARNITRPSTSVRQAPENLVNMHPIARMRYKHDHDEYSPYYY